jgi:hypothetical protein
MLTDVKNKTKERSPDLIGTVALQRSTFEEIGKQFQSDARKEVLCNIAAWDYNSEGNRCFYVEISPPYKKKAGASIFRPICRSDEE